MSGLPPARGVGRFVGACSLGTRRHLCPHCHRFFGNPDGHLSRSPSQQTRPDQALDVRVRHGTTWIQYYVSFYVYALVFVVFDVETVFLYPWAVAYGRLGLFALGEMLVFVAILVVGLLYALKKQALRWW